MNDFEPENCPVGIRNCSEIERVKDRLDMATERLEEKIVGLQEDLTQRTDSLTDRMDEGFKHVSGQLEKLNDTITSVKADTDKRIDEVEKSIDQKIEDKLEKKKGKAATDAWKWIFTGLFGSVFMKILYDVVAQLLGL